MFLSISVFGELSTINMSLGTITAHIHLDDRYHVHYGSDDVTGKVTLKYAPKQSGLLSRAKGTRQPDLFGPFKLNILLEGIEHIRVHQSGDAVIRHHRDTPLFSISKNIYDGACTFAPDGSMDIPFSIQFPESALARTEIGERMTMMQNETGQWETRRHGSANADGPRLPPSFSTNLFTRANDGEFGISYTLSTKGEMSGIDVKLECAEGSPPVLYEAPLLPHPPPRDAVTMTSRIQVISSKLMPESNRPHGFKGRTKALFHSNATPDYVFDMSCDGIPKETYLGSALTFKVRIKRNQEHTTPGIDAEVFLQDFMASIIAQTDLDLPKGPFAQLTSRPVDSQTGKSLQYRALEMLIDTFLSAETSEYHSCVWAVHESRGLHQICPYITN